jgi:hypothetical protein
LDESQHDSCQLIPKNPEAQDTSTEEPELRHVEEDEDGNDEEYSPLSDSENEKLYHDADERESYGVEALVLVGRLQALLVHMEITTTPKYRIKGVSHPGWVEYQAIVEIFSGSRVISRHLGQPSKHLVAMLWLMLHGRPSPLRATATRTTCRTQYTASYPSRKRISSRSRG